MQVLPRWPVTTRAPRGMAGRSDGSGAGRGSRGKAGPEGAPDSPRERRPPPDPAPGEALEGRIGESGAASSAGEKPARGRSPQGAAPDDQNRVGAIRRGPAASREGETRGGQSRSQKHTMAGHCMHALALPGSVNTWCNQGHRGWTCSLCRAEGRPDEGVHVVIVKRDDRLSRWAYMIFKITRSAKGRRLQSRRNCLEVPRRRSLVNQPRRRGPPPPRMTCRAWSCRSGVAKGRQQFCCGASCA